MKQRGVTSLLWAASKNFNVIMRLDFYGTYHESVLFKLGRMIGAIVLYILILV